MSWATTRVGRGHAGRHSDSGASGDIGEPLPAILRFLLFVGVIVGLVWGAMLALVTFVEPQPREMTQTIPSSRLNK